MTVTHSGTRRRHDAALIAVAVVIGLIGSGVLVWQSSYAAFTSTTTNPGNSFTAGSVTLADNDSGATMINVSNLKPGDSGRACITVGYSGTLPPAAAIQLYAGSVTNSLSLASNLYFSIEASTSSTVAASMAGGIFSANSAAAGACDALSGLSVIYGGVTGATNGNPTATKLLSDFQALTAYSSGATTSVASWTPAAQTGGNLEYEVFRIRYMLNPSAPDTVQGGTAGLSVNWEVRSS